jgi:hypothetical protein
MSSYLETTAIGSGMIIIIIIPYSHFIIPPGRPSPPSVNRPDSTDLQEIYTIGPVD